jgi:hypothetical protein
VAFKKEPKRLATLIEGERFGSLTEFYEESQYLQREQLANLAKELNTSFALFGRCMDITKTLS